MEAIAGSPRSLMPGVGRRGRELMKQLCKYAIAKATGILHAAIRESLYRLHGCFHETVTIPTKQGRLTMSTRDCGIAGPLFRTRQFEYDSSLRALHFLKTMKFISHEEVHMLDIGANIGVISIGLLLANEIGSAVAIEPEPKNFDLLVKNVKQNGLSEQMICLQMAVGDTESTLTMELSPINPGDHRVRSRPTEDASERHNESSRRTIQVQSLPLQRILELPEIRTSAMGMPSMVWIDVQGYEGYVFAGAKDTLGSGIPTVSEIWPYGIRRAGMSLDQFTSVVAGIWSEYWIERRNRFIRYPITVFDRYLDELGSDGHFENVIFTRSNSPMSGNTPANNRMESDK
jgi:FkbM family methyltransferase